MVFSTSDRKFKKLELFKVPVLLVITGKPQTLARDISGTQGQILILFFYLFVFSSSVSYVETENLCLPWPPLALKFSDSAL